MRKNSKEVQAARFTGKYGSLRANGQNISATLNDAGVTRLATYLEYTGQPYRQRFVASDGELARTLLGDLSDCPLRASHPEHMARLFGEHPGQKHGQSIFAYHEWVRLLETQTCVAYLPVA